GVTEQVGDANARVDKVAKDVNATEARVTALTKQLEQGDVPKQLAKFAAELKALEGQLGTIGTDLKTLQKDRVRISEIAAELKMLEGQLGTIRADLKTLQKDRVRISESDYFLIPAKRGWDLLNQFEKKVGFVPVGQNTFVPLPEGNPNVIAAWVKLVEAPKQALPSIVGLTISAHGNQLLLHANIQDKALAERMRLRVYALMR